MFANFSHIYCVFRGPIKKPSDRSLRSSYKDSERDDERDMGRSRDRGRDHDRDSRSRNRYADDNDEEIFSRAARERREATLRDRSSDEHEDRYGSTARGWRASTGGYGAGREPRAGSLDPMDRYADFYKGMSVEARYLGHGAWYEAKVVDVNPDRTVNVIYSDGEMATRLHPSTVRRVKEGKFYVPEDHHRA